MRTLVLVLRRVGVLFGAVEVARHRGRRALERRPPPRPLLALWGAGSLVGGTARRPPRRRRAQRAGLALAARPRWPPATSRSPRRPAALVALGAVLLVAGAAIAPTYASVYAMVDARARPAPSPRRSPGSPPRSRSAPPLGAAAAGALADHAGPAAAFVLAGAAGAVAVLVTALRAAVLPSTRRRPDGQRADRYSARDTRL